MPTKVDTETQLLRLLGNTPLQVQITLLRMGSHESRNTTAEHLEAFYATFDQVRDQKFDGLVVTGAPVETAAVRGGRLLAASCCEVMDWSTEHVFSTLHVCWGAQAALYHHYGVPKYPLDEKMFGVFEHRVLDPRSPVLQRVRRGLPGPALPAHRRSAPRTCRARPELDLLAESDEAGVYLAASEDGRQIFVTGHPEYDARHPAGRVRPGRGPRAADRRPAQLLPGRRPDAGRPDDLALARVPALRELAELLRLPAHPVRPGRRPNSRPPRTDQPEGRSTRETDPRREDCLSHCTPSSTALRAIRTRSDAAAAPPIYRIGAATIRNLGASHSPGRRRAVLTGHRHLAIMGHYAQPRWVTLDGTSVRGDQRDTVIRSGRPAGGGSPMCGGSASGGSDLAPVGGGGTRYRRRAPT